ncbi:MAG: ABC transporter ATP-binding protein [Longicatena sp.]
MFEINQLKYKNILHIEHLCLQRQITCITGASGSGKTTLLRTLNRLNTIDEGVILYNDEDISVLDPIELRRKIVMLGQTPVIYDGTIEDNLQIGLLFSEQPKASQAELLKYLAKVNLTKRLEDTCEKLSGGEKQRLCLARIMLMNADVYLVDEPSSALDKETEQFVIDNLVDFVLEKDKELIMVTHSSQISQKYKNSIIVMEKGNCGGYEYE